MTTTTTATETTATTKITKTENCTETMYTAAFTTVNTDGAPVKRYSIGTNYTFGTRTYSVVGVRKYTGDAHSYWLVKFDSDPTTHEMTADKIKDYIGDDRKQPRDGSANDGKKATGTKRVPKTANELANQINAKYSDLVKTIREKVGKIPTNAVIESALDMLCEEIEKACAIRVYEVLNAAEKEYKDNIQRRDEIKHAIEINEERLAEVYAAKDYVMVSEYGKQIQGFQAELILLEQKIAAYEAAQKEGENSDEKPAALDDNGGETPAEAETSEETNED